MHDDSRRKGELIQVLDPKDTNVYGNIFGGVIMSLMDKAAAVAAWRYSRKRVLTVAADEITFRSSIEVGEVVTAAATVVHVGRTSMDVEVVVTVQNLITDDVRVAASGFFTMVAVDDAWRPTPVTPWTPVEEVDQEKWHAAVQRRENRLSRTSG